MSVAFAPERDADATRASLAARGLHPSEPRALGRALELPEGSVTPRFSLLNLPSDETPALDCFVCGHLTPELVRRPEWLAHPNGVIGIAAVHLHADDPEGLAAAYRRLFGAARVTPIIGGIAVDTGRNRLLFTEPPALDPDLVPPPIIAALELRVESGARTAAYLKETRIPSRDLPDSRIAVLAGEANGTMLLFSE